MSDVAQQHAWAHPHLWLGCCSLTWSPAEKSWSSSLSRLNLSPSVVCWHKLTCTNTPNQQHRWERMRHFLSNLLIRLIRWWWHFVLGGILFSFSKMNFLVHIFAIRWDLFNVITQSCGHHRSKRWPVFLLSWDNPLIRIPWIFNSFTFKCMGHTVHCRIYYDLK